MMKSTTTRGSKMLRWMLAAVLAAATLHGASAAAGDTFGDTYCTYGIKHPDPTKLTCCASTCRKNGVNYCGASNCAQAPINNPAANCCHGTIRYSGKPCKDYQAPCWPYQIAPTPAPTATPTTAKPVSVAPTAAPTTAKPVSVAPTAAPTTVYGTCPAGSIPNWDKTVCCPSTCGTCGGSGCDTRPGGATNCCKNPIISSGKTCSTNSAPCILSDPHCTLGIKHPVSTNKSCCAKACGTTYCGTSNCGSGPGGAAACCGSTIIAAAKACSANTAPCYPYTA